MTGQALRASAAIDENDFIGSRTGSRDYIEKLEGLFVSAQQNRAFRLDFSNIKQNRSEGVLEYYSRLITVAKSAKMTNIDPNVNCKDRFIHVLRSPYIKRKLLEDEKEGESLNQLMVRSSNLESIDRNLSRQAPLFAPPATPATADSPEPMEIGTMHWRPNYSYSRPYKQPWSRPIRPPARFSSPRGIRPPFPHTSARMPWNRFNNDFGPNWSSQPPRYPGYFNGNRYNDRFRPRGWHRYPSASAPPPRPNEGIGWSNARAKHSPFCLLYTSDAADE